MPRVAHPAPAVTGDVCRVTVVVIADSEQCLFSLDYMAAGFSTSPATDLGGLLAIFATIFAPGIKATLDAASMLNGFLGTFLSRADIATQFTTSGNGVGLIAGTHLDKQLAARFQKVSVLKGAHGRGGMSFGPLSTTFVTPGTDPNRLNVAGTAALTALATPLAAPLTITVGSFTTFTPCVSTRPPVGTSITQFAQTLSKVTVDSVIGTVRRRRIGRGI